MKRNILTTALYSKLQIVIAFCFLIFFTPCSGQSISGNVNSSFSSRNLGYANVDIYKKGKLVANVLTDELGNFNVKLDTGLYECEIHYAGFEKVTKEIKVSKDEKAEFSMNEDIKSKFSAAKAEAHATAKIEEYSVLYNKMKNAESIQTSNAWNDPSVGKDAVLGQLTAGEINDFSKWELWNDLAKGELNANQSFWNFAPTGRYVVQAKDPNGLPLANAKVELLNGTDVLYTSRTDNTGKAELWESLKYNLQPAISTASLRITYHGESKTIASATKSDAGINTVIFNTECGQSQNVDIAVVVDATGSMQDEIEYLKLDLNDVIFKSKEYSNTLNFRFANIFYRDNGDEYVTQTQDFTRVLSESTEYTNAHNAGGGGDEQEAVEAALDEAINKLNWSSDTRTKILFLVLDASPHNTFEIQEKMRNLASQAAGKGIRIVPVTGSGSRKDTEYLMRCLALATNGTYTFLTDHSAVGGSHIKASTDSYQVEVLNNLLVRIIKAYTYMPDCQQYIADIGVNLPDSQVVVTDYIDSTKIDTTKETIAGTGDLNDSLKLEWKFYPNPTNGIINIVSNKEIAELYISDLSGKALQTIRDIRPGEVATADLSQYATGIYLIRYPVGKQWISGKIVLFRN